MTAVFVVLLSADSGFAAVVNAVEARLGEGVSFAAWSLLTTAGALFGTALFDRRPAEPARRAASPFRIPTRDHVAVSHGAGRPLIEPTTWLMVVGQVALVFAVFVVANLHALFGGHALVRAPGSLTYSNYLHTGFGQLLFAAALSLTLVVVGHAALRGRGAGDPASPVPGGVKAKVAECTLLALTAVTVVSCAQRLAVYEDAYGASRLRLGVAFILLGVVIALGLTALTSVRRGWRGYGGALAASMVGLVVLASATNADQYVARTNLDRASRGLPLDVDYLASLSRDAAPALDHPYLASHPEAARALREAYCAPRASRDLRAWRGLGSCPAAEPYVPVLTVATHTPDTLAGGPCERALNARERRLYPASRGRRDHVRHLPACPSPLHASLDRRYVPPRRELLSPSLEARADRHGSERARRSRGLARTATSSASTPTSRAAGAARPRTVLPSGLASPRGSPRASSRTSSTFSWIFGNDLFAASRSWLAPGPVRLLRLSPQRLRRDPRRTPRTAPRHGHSRHGRRPDPDPRCRCTEAPSGRPLFFLVRPLPQPEPPS